MLTSRNALPCVRRALARRWPELTRANGGGTNAILVRGEIAAHAHRRLRLWPERRLLHAVQDGEGRWIANVHASTHPPRAHADLALARVTALRWAAGAPLVFGGDFNVVRPDVPGFKRAGGQHVDHVYAHGLKPAGEPELLDAGELSDHRPLRVALT